MPELDGYGNEVQRGRYGGYLLDGVEYIRTTSAVGAIDDKSTISDWKVRMAIKGFDENPELKKEYDRAKKAGEKNQIVGYAIEASGAYERRELGTEVHYQLECADLDKPGCPPELQKRWFAALKEAGLRIAANPTPMVERVLFNEQLGTGGMTDRMMISTRPLKLNGEEVVPENTLLIGDIKTGKYPPTSRYSGSIFRQLCVYASSSLTLNHEGKAVPISHWPICQDYAVVAHVHPEKWDCHIYLCDLRDTMREIEAVAAVQRSRHALRHAERLN